MLLKICKLQDRKLIESSGTAGMVIIENIHATKNSNKNNG